jgi:deoxyadenosine/deoxycytidine kinase
MSSSDLLIGVVGPCSAGKTTLIASLADQGLRARHIAQEHSYIPDMWRRLVKPGVLIYLDVSYDVSMKRRLLDMSATDFAKQCERLVHARQHADLFIQTDSLSPQDVLTLALDFINAQT